MSKAGGIQYLLKHGKAASPVTARTTMPAMNLKPKKMAEGGKVYPHSLNRVSPYDFLSQAELAALPNWYRDAIAGKPDTGGVSYFYDPASQRFTLANPGRAAAAGGTGVAGAGNTGGGGGGGGRGEGGYGGGGGGPTADDGQGGLAGLAVNLGLASQGIMGFSPTLGLGLGLASNVANAINQSNYGDPSAVSGPGPASTNTGNGAVADASDHGGPEGDGNDGGGGACVDPAVHVLLADGTTIPAGDLSVGDMVHTMNETTLEWGNYEVVYKAIVVQPKFMVFFTDDTSIITSESHKFFMTDMSWKPVSAIIPGDVINGVSGSIKTVTGKQALGDGDVVMLTIDEAHTYVSDGLISHNKFANGGMVRKYADGGIANLGGYSDGGQLLRGPGDGVSDSIPAKINGHQPARLADGEFVIPARIVSELGNGSTEAGSRKLYAMLERIQKGRKKTMGKKDYAKDSKADKHLPA